MEGQEGQVAHSGGYAVDAGRPRRQRLSLARDVRLPSQDEAQEVPDRRSADPPCPARPGVFYRFNDNINNIYLVLGCLQRIHDIKTPEELYLKFNNKIKSGEVNIIKGGKEIP